MNQTAPTKQTELVKRAQTGDPEAQGQLYEQMYKRVYYLALRLTQQPEDAEDAAQETFLSAFRALPGLSAPAAFEGWLFQITANKARKLLVKRGRTVDLPEDEDGRTLLDDLPERDEALIPEAAADSAEHRQIILSIIDALPEAQRECVYLFYYSELSVKQIAETLGCSEGTVKSRLNYARQKIKDGVLATEERDGIRLHVLAPIGLLFARDFDLATAGITAASLGGVGAAAAAGESAAGAASTGTGSAKAGLLAAAKTKVIAGVTAAALVTGGAVAVTRSPAVTFTDPALEQNVRVLLDLPQGTIREKDLDDLYALCIFDGGMALDGEGAWEGPQEGTGTVESLEDLSRLPQLQAVYYYGTNEELLSTLDGCSKLTAFYAAGADTVLSDLSFLEGLDALRDFSADVAPGTDLSPLEGRSSLRSLYLSSRGALSLKGDELSELVELGLSSQSEGAVCTLELSQPMPALRSLMIFGGQIPSLDMLANIPQLRSLELYGTNAGRWDLTPIGGLKELRLISLIGQYDDTFDLSPLAQCSALEVYHVPNGLCLSPPPQAVTDTDGEMPLYNAVSMQIQEENHRLIYQDED